MDVKQSHWDEVYESKASTDVSWYEPRPVHSLRLIRQASVAAAEPIIDVGGGASLLVDELLASGYQDLTVLDISEEALRTLRQRLGEGTSSVSLLHGDVRSFRPERRYALWHDRAVFHFLVDKQDRERYVEALRHALSANGHVVMATFGPSGPESCSGLPTRRYDERALAAELGGGFMLVESSLVVHRTPWNTSQQFLYCRFVRRPSGR